MSNAHLLVTILCLGLAAFSPLFAQNDRQLAQLEPGDVYFQAYLQTREAKDLIAEKKFVEAFEKLQRAKHLFNTLAVNHPNFKPDLVEGRRQTTLDTLEEIHGEALLEAKEENKAKPRMMIESAEANAPLTRVLPTKIDRTTPDATKVRRLQGQIDQLKQQLATTMNDRDAKAARLRRTLRQLQEEKAKEATAAVRSQLDTYQRQIKQLREDNQALEFSLQKTRRAYRKSQAELESAHRDLTKARNQIAELNKIIEEQTDTNNRIVRGQQQQIDELRRQFKDREKDYAASLAEIRTLKTQLSQSNDMLAELQKERDGIAQQRDHMASLLKVADGDRLQTVIDQNVSLGRELQEATRRLKVLETEGHARDDLLLEAKNRLVVAKQRILKLQAENKTRQENIAALKERLETVEADLAVVAKDPEITKQAREENVFLRDIIKKQKTHMELQQRSAELLIAAATKEAEEGDEGLAQALSQFEGTFRPALTEEEEDLVANADSDFTITSQFRPGEAERKAAGQRLDQLKNNLNRVAVRMAERKDFEAARGNFEMIVEEDPGDWEAMVNLGIVHLNLDNPTDAIQNFEQAVLVAGDRGIPYAHFMLGVAHKKLGHLENSALELRKSLKLEPENPKAHIILGTILGTQGNLDAATKSFNKALELRPTMWEPYRNLAQLAKLQGAVDDAKKFYQQGLKNGGPIDIAFESSLQ